MPFNKESFSELIKVHSKEIYNFCLYLTGNPNDAHDLSQDVFINAYRSIEKFRQDWAFSTWLHTIALNLYRDRMRRRKTVKFTPMDDEKEFSDKQIPVEKQLEDSELKKKILKSLDLLSQEQKVPIVLKYLEGKSLEETAKLCNCSIGTVSSRISRGIKILRG